MTTMGLMAAIAVVVAVLARADAAARRCSRSWGRGSTRCGCAIPPPMSRRSSGVWAKWAREIAKRPLVAGLAALAILIPLTIPLLSLKLGQQDTAALSTSTTARRAYDLISQNFGPGVNGPLLIAVTLGSPATNGTSDPRLPTLQKDVASTAGVAGVSPISSTRPGRPRTSTRSPRPGRPTTRQRRSSTSCATPRSRSREGHEHDAPTSAAARPATTTSPRRSRASCRCRSWS